MNKYVLLLSAILVGTLGVAKGAALTSCSCNGCEKVTSCPTMNGEYALHLPNPDDCGSFCKCDWGVAYYFACPDGLHFNAELQVCDWPYRAGCSESPPVTTTKAPCTNTTGTTTTTTRSTTTTTTTTTTPKPCEVTTTTPKPCDTTTTTTTTTTTAPCTQNGCEKVTCPELNGEYALHLPNPDDCESFCTCNWGTAIHQDCPDGLHFNAELQVCDWPYRAGCRK